MCLTVPGRIVSVTDDAPETRTARVDVGGTIRTANLAFTPEAEVGDFVIVQAGFATRRLNEAEAREALEYHRQLEELAQTPSVTPTPGGPR
jgi:hydrogenase expression/formation protein HypC